MKRYILRRVDGTARCMVIGHDGVAYPLPHLVHHSPTGFEWGYGGSGPADLARSIVGDLLGTDTPSPQFYQHVKRALIAHVPETGTDIPEQQIRDALRFARKELYRAPAPGGSS